MWWYGVAQLVTAWLSLRMWLLSVMRGGSLCDGVAQLCGCGSLVWWWGCSVGDGVAQYGNVVAQCDDGMAQDMTVWLSLGMDWLSVMMGWLRIWWCGSVSGWVGSVWWWDSSVCDGVAQFGDMIAQCDDAWGGSQTWTKLTIEPDWFLYQTIFIISVMYTMTIAATGAGCGPLVFPTFSYFLSSHSKYFFLSDLTRAKTI